MNVLHVDDEADIREITRLSLEMDGRHAVVSVATGREAIEAIQACKPSIILLDVMMPDMSGPELKAKLNEVPSTESIPVISMTAATQPDVLKELSRFGAIGILAKPFDPMTLADTLESYLASTAHTEIST